ncbi:MAG TPA: amidohydrolase [Thermoanaerobaculia bacterium]
MRSARMFFAALIVPLACTTARMDTGTIFTASTVLSGASQTPVRDGAIYVTAGVIREVGTERDIRRAHPYATIVGAPGAAILPGLTDAHAHLYGLGLSLDEVDLTGAASFDEVIARVKQRASTAPANEWTLGRGWDQTRWPAKEFPTAGPLDAALGDRPVWLKRVDGHAGLASSAAMRLAGINASTPDPVGGRIIRDPSGNPTGVFVDNAQDLVEAKIPEPTHDQVKRRVLAAAQRIAENGLTEIHDAGAGADTIRAVRELIDEKRFPIRLYQMVSDDAALLREWFARGPMIDYGGRWTIRAVKMYADGALGSRGAALLAPYSDDPNNTGLLVSTVEHMTEVARRARAAGFQVNTHAIGDRGVRNVIDAYEAAGITPPNRSRIEHLQVVAPTDFARVARDGIIASMQPTHATSDMRWAEARLGPERIEGAYAWRTVLNSGARLALGSDFPVEAVNPWFGIYSAVTRQDQDGNPPGGWYPQQKLTIAEAIRGFTLGAAYAAFEEDSRGTIEPGKLADFTVVDADPYTFAPLFKMKTRMTIVNGNVVYRAR